MTKDWVDRVFDEMERRGLGQYDDDREVDYDYDRVALPWAYDDGGRKAAGYRGTTGDCVTRAFAIALDLPYAEVYKGLDKAGLELAAKARRGSRRAVQLAKSSARTGVMREVYEAWAAERGWAWVPLQKIGEGTRYNLGVQRLPVELSARLVAGCSRHLTAVVDGVARDTYDPTRGGWRAVSGVYVPSTEAEAWRAHVEAKRA